MAFSNKVIDGGDILLEIDGKVLGCSTTHTIETTTATRETNCKGTGDWTGVEYSRLSWSGTTDALFNLEDSGTFVRYKDLFQLMISKSVVTITSTYTEGADTFEMVGDAIITSISQVAGDQENATYSVAFQGRGPLGIVGEDLFNVTVTAAGATHVVCEETNKVLPYDTNPVVFKLPDGTYNFTGFDETTQGRNSVVVSGADAAVTVTLA